MNKLIIFIKNPVKGKVKTRLAAAIGEDKALEIYRKLLHYTLEEVKKTPAEIHLFFSDEKMDISGFEHFHIQSGKDLGERMKNAFVTVLTDKTSRAVIIGTDCAEISSGLIQKAFMLLDSTEVVIGPALDGGYYLLGMKKLYSQLFENIPWSTNNVLALTKKLSADNNLSYTELKTLRDIDMAEDLKFLPEDF